KLIEIPNLIFPICEFKRKAASKGAAFLFLQAVVSYFAVFAPSREVSFAKSHFTHRRKGAKVAKIKLKPTLQLFFCILLTVSFSLVVYPSRGQRFVSMSVNNPLENIDGSREKNHSANASQFSSRTGASRAINIQKSLARTVDECGNHYGL